MGNVYAAGTVTNPPLTLDFYNEENGQLTDPDAIQLDITFGTEVSLIPDYAGPFTYAGASAPSPGVLYRIAAGQYGFEWPIPANAQSGVYVANWSCQYQGDTFLGVENFTVTGGVLTTGQVSGDLGYWTGSLSFAGKLVSFGATDASGITWLWRKLEGWDGPDVSGGIAQRSEDHGGWPSPQFFAPRNLTLTVTASAPTQALRDQARAALSQVVPVSGLATLLYNEPVPKVAYVRRSGKLTEAYPTLADVTFTIGLVAPDPRKYGSQVNSVSVPGGSTGAGLVFPVVFPVTFPAAPPAGVVTVTNAGNFETRPQVQVTGPVTSPSLTNVTTGQTVTWTGLVVPANGYLLVDFYNRLATDASGMYHPADVASSWWAMEPGPTTIQLGGQPGNGSLLTVTWQSAFI